MNGFHFADPSFLNLLVLLPFYWVVINFLKKSRRKGLQNILGEKNYGFLASSFDPQKAKWKMRLEILILASVIFALARPQVEGGKQKVRNEGIEVLMVIDVSRSMLAEDLKPNRLEVAKRELARLVDLSPGDRFGVAAFAGSAVLMSPMTTDKDAIRMYLDSLTPDSVSSQGTDFSKALEISYDALKRGGLGDEGETVVTRAVIIASDGEDHQKAAQEFVDKISKDDVKVFTLAFGTEKGGPIPVKDAAGETRGYLTDRSGKTVISQMNPEALKDLAKRGGGSFHHFTFNNDVISEIRSDLEGLQKAKFSDGEISIYEEKFQVFLIVAVLLGIIYLTLGDRKGPGRIWRGRFEAEAS